MKKILLFMLTIMLGLGSWQMSAQVTVEIGTGTTTSSNGPFNSVWGYSFVEQIYTAAEIGMPGSITSISFNNSSSGQTNNITVYMKNVSRSSFSSTSDYETVTAADIVYTGSHNFSQGWSTINLDSPFLYDGSSNLMIAVHENTSGYTTQYFYCTTTTNSVVSYHSDGSDPNPYSLGSYSGNSYTSSNRPNIKIGIVPGTISCHNVGVVTVSNITATNATLTWNTPEDGGTYIVQYKTEDQDWGGSNVITETQTDTTFDFLDALSPMTTYNVRVANYCGGGDTSIWRSVTFTTACSAITTLPYMNGFDTYGTGENAYPDCWTKINTYTGYNRPYVNSTHYGGVGSLYFFSTSTTYNIAITPLFDASIDISTLQADFMYRANAASDRLIVGVMTDFTDASTFFPVDTIMPGSTATAWVNRTVNFSNYTGTGQYIAFKNQNTTASGYAYIDNLSIDLISTCPKPDAVALSNFTADGCDVSWTPGGTELSWEVVAVPHNDDVNLGTPLPAYSSPFTLTGLIDDTQYDVYVRADCGGNDYSSWTFSVSFTTTPLCSFPLNVTTGQVTGTSALVTWNPALYGATGYTVGYSEAGQDNWTTQSVTGMECMLSGLAPDTDYDVFVLSECDAGDADTVFTSFTTHCLAGGDPFTEGTISTYLIPLNNYYNYTYTQQIFLASEMGGPQTIDSIAFEYGYSTASTDKTDVTIYLGHTSQSTFSSISNYIPSSGLQQVYSGHLNCSQGWNTFVFTTPFQYNGTDNLVLVVDDNSGAYDGNAYTFKAHNAGAVRAVYYYSDGTNPTPSNPTTGNPNSSTTSNRSNVKFFNPCDNTITCIAPNPYVTEVTDNSISVSWAPGLMESSWEIESSTDNMTWTSEGSATSAEYTLSNLASNTLYYIRLRSICGGGEYSNWVMVSARTECAPVSIPYTENFESTPGSGSGNMAYCWTTGTNYTSTHYPYTSSSQHHGGNYSAYFYGASSYYSYMASPAFDENVDMANLQVRFFAYKSSASYYIQVGVMTDPNDPGTFVQVGQNLTPSTNSTWELLEVNTDSYTGNGRYIAFRLPQDISNYMYVDDITVDIIPSCLHVSNIQVANITTTTADLSWTAGGDETEWAVVYGPAGSIVDPENETALVASGVSEITLSNLYPSTNYDVFVKAVCSSTESSFWWQGSFNTLCGEISVLPLMENFDDMGTGSAVYPNCWLRHNNYSTSTNYPHVSSSFHTSGNASLYFYCSSSTYNYAVLPAMDVNTYPINTLQVSFKMRSTSSATTSSIQVGVMTDSSDVSTFVPVENVHNTTTGVFEQFDVPLTSYTGSGRFIALKLVNTSSTYSIYLDDLMVDLAPLCDKPTYVMATNITATGADINWMPGGNETDWEILVVPAGMSIITGTPEPVSTHPYTLGNLNDNTAYEVYVRADCGTGVDFSSWSQVCNFTTTPLCSAPTDVEVSQIAGASALLTWTPAVFGANGYTVAYTETGMNNWISQSVTGNSFMLSGLTPETPYTVTITSECDEGTAPAVTKTFTTGCLSGGEIIVGNGTTGTYNIPLNTFYNYSYVQQLYLASEINYSGAIQSIGFQYIYSTAQTKTNQSIYLAETDLTNLSTWIPSDSLTLVYQGSITYNNSGSDNWVTITLNTPFNYSGNRNLVVVVKNDHGDYTTSSNNTFKAHSASGKVLQYYDDDGAFNFSSPESPSTYSSRNNIRFGMECDYTVTCIAPNVYVSDVTENSITVDWAAGNTESSWEIETSTDGATWTTEGTFTSAPFTLSNLQPTTLYYIRLRSDCGGGEYSSWTVVSQRTECALIATLPYTENFDTWTGSTSTTVSVNNLPYCWSYHNGGTNTTYSGYPMIYASATYAESGSNSLRFYTYSPTGTYDDQTAILPPIDVNTLPMNTLQLAFDARALSTSYPFELVIGVMTDPTDINTFMPVSTVTTQSTTYANYEIPLNQYTGTGAYIAVKAPKPATGYNYGYVDNVRVEFIPSCPKPTNVTSTAATTSSVTLGWTEVGTATSWIITYGPLGFTPGTSVAMTETVYDNPYTITGLSASTVYDFYVQADCDGGSSNMSNVYTAATECDVITALPLMENFDAYPGTTSTSAATTNLPYCWSNYNTGTSTSYSGYPIIYSSATYAASGNNAMRFYMYTTSGTYSDQTAILPAIDVNTFPMNTLQLTFDARELSSSYPFTLVVGVMSDPTNISTFTAVQTVTVNSTTYNTFEVPLTSYTGTGAYIAIKGTQPTSNYNYGYVDNIIVDIAPLCDKPTNVTASNITAYGADINWTPGGNETGWEIVAVPAGMSITTGTPEPVSTHPYTLTGLNDNTAYDVYVRADCGTGVDFSSWSLAGHFTTTPLCSAPTDVEVSQIAGTSALLTWTPAVFGANSYTVAYTETGLDSWTTQSVAGNSFMLSGLTPETPYTVTITSECDEGTAPVITKTFTTPCLYGGTAQIGNGTTATYQLPLNNYYHYSYTQQIFLASELSGAATINNIAFEYSYSSPSTVKTNVSIYLGHTTKTSFSSASDTVNPANLQLVYTGPMNCQQGWNTFNFTTPFQYNGTDNLVIAVDDNSDAYNGNSYTFYAHNAGATRSLHYYSDSYNMDPANPGSSGASSSTTSNRTNIRISLPCDYTVTCIAPNVYVSDVTENSITVDWAPGNTESSWEIETSTDDSTWTSEGTVTSAPYTINNLQPNTLYYIRLRSDCGGGEYSSWTVVSERTDCAPIATLPYTENFDTWTGSTSTTVSVNNLPYCWSYLNAGTSSTYSGYPMIYASATYAESGSNSMRFYTYTTSGTYADQTAILPPVDVNTLPINTLQLTFDARALSTSYPFNLEIGVMTDPTDINTFTLVSTVTTQSTTYANYEIPLSQYTGLGAYIAIKAPQPTTGYNYGYVDNVVVGPLPSCPLPTQVHATNVTTTSVDLGWAENGSATSWVIEYGPAGFAHGSGTVENASSNPYTISNLNASTVYDFYVKADCGGGDMSNYSSIYTTATACGAIDQLPYTENFDTWIGSTTTSVSINNLPNCWTYSNGGTNTSYSGYPIIYTSSTYAASGSNAMRFYSYTTSGTYADQTAILPPVDVNTIPVNTLQLVFAARQNTSSYPFVLEIGVMTNPTDINTFTLVSTVTCQSTIYTNYEIPLSQYTGTGAYVAIRAPQPTSGYNYGYVDNVVLENIPACPKPMQLHASDISSTYADVSWTPVGSETSWVVEHKAATASTWTVATATSPSYHLTGLTALTAYDVRVKADCGDETSQYVTTSFTTANCDLSDACQYTFILGDGYGDGWNNGYLTVLQGGVAVATVEAVNHNLSEVQTYDTVLVTLCDNQSTTLNWSYGSYDDEVSVKVLGPDGTQVFYLYDLSTASTTLYTFTSDCSGAPAFDPTVATGAASGLAPTSATLNATITNPDNVTVTAKGFQWKATAGGTYTQIAGTGTGNAFSANLTGLTPNTSYTFKAYITFNGQTVYGSEQTFTTLQQGVEPCDVPTGLHSTTVENEAITIAWDADANVNSWNIQYRPVGGSLSSATSNTNSYTITGLTGDTDYEIQVQANCGDGNVSDWTSQITVHTTNVGIENYLANNVALFPNPAREYVDIRVDGDVNVTAMEVFDVYGKLINTVAVVDNPTRINVSGLADGMYFVRVTTDNGTVTKSFVKK